jgi:hypothetical protein
MVEDVSYVGADRAHPSRGCGLGLLVVVGRRKVTREEQEDHSHLADNGDDVAARIVKAGEARTSLETGMTQLATASPAEARTKPEMG